MTELVLWDWNGTLLDDLDLCVDALNRLLARFGYPQQYDLEGYRAIFDFPIRDYYLRAGFDFEKHSFAELAESYMQDYIPASRACGAMNGARETLGIIQSKGIRQAVLSASKISTLRQQVGHCDLQQYFETLLGLADIYAASKVDIGLGFMARCGIDPANALMVGDTLHDSEVAAAMGCRCVLVARGHHSAEKLAAAGVPVLEDITQVPDYL